MSKRSKFYEYYKKSKEERQKENFVNALQSPFGVFDPLKKSSSSTAHQERFSYKGSDIQGGVVVRCDLNGYSSWARDKSLSDRAMLLDSFFSYTFSELDRCGGVYFRDEGDCLVAIFSNYFDDTASFERILEFCRNVVRNVYGKDELTAKVIVTCGQIAIFQKSHEVGTDDWSAEGEPFVLAARVEQAIESKQRIYYFKSDYENHFKQKMTWAQPGGVYYWNIANEKIQIKGIGKKSGWEEFTVFEYIQGGARA